MAWASAGNKIYSGKSSTSGNVLTLDVAVGAATLPAGNVVIVAIASDNTSSGDSQTSLVSSVTASFGTFDKIVEFTNGQTAAATGATVSVWKTKTTANTFTDAITVNFASNITAKAGWATEFTIGAGNTVSVRTFVTNATDGANPAAQTISALAASTEYLFYHALAHEGSNTNSITSSTSYTFAPTGSGGSNYNAQFIGTTGGSSALNMCVAAEYRINTSTTETVDFAGTNADHAQVFIAIREKSTGPGPIVGSTTATFSATGTVTGALALAGTSSPIFTPSGTLTGALAVVGSTTATFSTTATGTAYSLITGSATATFSTAGTVTGALALTGTSTPTFTPSATLTGDLAVAGTSIPVFSATGLLTGDLALAGTSTPVFAASGTLVNAPAGGDIVGSTTFTFTPTATLTGDLALVGTSAPTFTGSATLTGSLALVGTSSPAFTTAGLLTGALALAGLSSPAFTPSATLAGDLALTGTSTPTFTTNGTMQTAAEGALSGTSSAAFTTSATLLGDLQMLGASSFAFTVAGLMSSDGGSTGEPEHHGKGDEYRNPSQYANIYKPTGLVNKPKSRVQERIEETADIHAEVSQAFHEQLALEAQVEANDTPTVEMTQAEIDFEIGVLMRKRMRTEDEELMLLMLMVS